MFIFTIQFYYQRTDSNSSLVRQQSIHWDHLLCLGLRTMDEQWLLQNSNTGHITWCRNASSSRACTWSGTFLSWSSSCSHWDNASPPAVVGTPSPSCSSHEWNSHRLPLGYLCQSRWRDRSLRSYCINSSPGTHQLASWKNYSNIYLFIPVFHTQYCLVVVCAPC